MRAGFIDDTLALEPEGEAVLRLADGGIQPVAHDDARAAGGQDGGIEGGRFDRLRGRAPVQRPQERADCGGVGIVKVGFEIETHVAAGPVDKKGVAEAEAAVFVGDEVIERLGEAFATIRAGGGDQRCVSGRTIQTLLSLYRQK